MTIRPLPPLLLLFVISLWHHPATNAGNPPTSTNTGSGAAVISGVVRIDGKLPAHSTISMAADPNCAKQYPGPVSSKELVTDTHGGLQNAIVFVSDGLGDRTFDPPSQPVVIDQKGCMYQPHVVAMRANQPLELVNDDPMLHNIHPMPTNNREWNKAQPPGAKGEETFSREEVAIPVKCNIHPWMRGYVAVFKHPYFAVTNRDGSFDLKGLPPGTYTIEAWHEKLGTATQRISVGANENKVVDFVFKSNSGM